MAVHVVKNPPRPWGNVIAQSLGTTLSHLAEAKVNKMKTHEDIKLLSSLGIDPLHARFINSLPAEQKREAVGNYLNAKQQQGQQQQEQQQESPIQQILAPQQQQMQQQPQQAQERPGLSNLFNQGTTGSGINPQFLQGLLQSPQRQQQQNQIQAQEQQQIAQQAQQQQQGPAVQQPAGPSAIAPKAQTNPLAAALKPANVTAQEVAATRRQEAAARKEEFEREKIAKKEEQLANKETQKYYEEVISGEKAAKESDQDLKKMKRLIEKGKLPPAALYKSLKDAEESLSSFGGAAKNIGVGGAAGFALAGPLGAAVGAGLGVAVSPVATMALYGVRSAYPDTEEFEKLSNGFIRYAKGIFGSRITDQDLKAFLATVPTLANTEHGKKAIIHNMDLFNKAVHAKYDVMREIIKENGGKRPLDLAIQVQERAEARVNSIANEWEQSAESEEASLLKLA